MTTFDLEQPIRQHVQLHGWPQIGPDQHQAVADVLRSGRLVDGPAVDRLEQAWAERLGTTVNHVLTCSSGTHALTLALQALGIGEGDKVLVPAYTFSGSVFPILQVGATPVFIDTHLDRHTLKIEQAWAAAKDDPKIKAVIAVHLHGSVVDIPLLASGLPHGVKVIEDCCQAHGSQHDGRLRVDGTVDGPLVGLQGDAAAWSLNQTKALPAGEGGLLHLNDEHRADDARTLRRFGEQWDGESPRTYLVEDERGGNGRMDDMSAALGASQLCGLDIATARGRANANRLLEALRPLERKGTLRLPKWQDGHSWQKFLVRFIDRDTQQRALAAALANDLPVCLWQREPLSRHPAFARYKVVADEHAFRTTETSVLIFTERHPLFAQDGPAVSQIATRLITHWSNL